MGACFIGDQNEHIEYSDENTIRGVQSSIKTSKKSKRYEMKPKSKLLVPDIINHPILEEDSYAFSTASLIPDESKKSIMRGSTGYQSQLIQASSLSNPLGEIITSQAIVTLFNVATGRYLHSHVVKYENGSKQNEICACSDGFHEYDQWHILVHQEGAIEDRNIVVFYHTLTKYVMRSSPQHRSIKSKLQQVYCVNSLTDLQNDDYWKINIMNDSDKLRENCLIRIQHLATEGSLQPTKHTSITKNELEVVVTALGDQREIWMVQVLKE